MSIRAKISSKDGDIADFFSRNNRRGPVVYQDDVVATEPTTKFFVNPDFGGNMNLDAGFTGTPEIIHNGINTVEYLAASIQGTKFTFNSTDFAAQSNITITSFGDIVNGTGVTINSTAFLEDDTPTGTQWLAVTSNNVTATNLAAAIDGTAGFSASATAAVVTVSEDTGVGITTFTEDINGATLVAPASIKTNNCAVGDVFELPKGSDLTLANFTAVTMRIYVDSDWAADDNFIICGYDNGLGQIVGNAVDLADYFNFPDFDRWHALVVPLADLGIASATTVDAFRIELTAKEGAKSPLAYFDRIQLEATGGSEMFRFFLKKNERFHIEELVFTMADAFNNANGIPYDGFLGLSALPNGFNILRTKFGKTLFVANIQTLGDHISAGAKKDEDDLFDGTNTFITWRAGFDRPLILTGDSEDQITITINDDMSGLLHFRVAARGGLETL